ncbi:protein-L-isoaspartate(D-aspartate) O-methyltransferase [Pseudomonadota bacterium]
MDDNHSPQDSDPVQAHRDRLVKEIVREALETAFWTGRDKFAPKVLDAIARVPRHAFVPEVLPLELAYANRPLPIGFGQTISQPYIVALMSDLLDLEGTERVLEIGTGCGYQSAVLAELGTQVYSVERIGELAAMANATLAELGYTNVRITEGDGAIGWAEHAPYDAILVTACAESSIPEALIEQLAPGGRMIIPVGPRCGPQMLHLGLKDDTGRFTHQPVLAVAFVPLVTRLERS